jgi:hypothetical protein
MFVLAAAAGSAREAFVPDPGPLPPVLIGSTGRKKTTARYNLHAFRQKYKILNRLFP